jgi:uncharacterized membrane protein YedE/YeeE
MPQSEDYLVSLIGGVIIAISTSINLYFNGRVTGMSGIYNTLMKGPNHDDFPWKFGFLAGLIMITFPLWYGLRDNSMGAAYVKFQDYDLILFDSVEASVGNLHIAGWITGGFLVGVGTKLGSGCTSGHGVCGLPRFSMRSFVAVCTFMSTGVAMATIKYYSGLFETGQNWGKDYTETWSTISIVIYGIILLTSLVLIA